MVCIRSGHLATIKSLNTLTALYTHKYIFKFENYIYIYFIFFSRGTRISDKYRQIFKKNDEKFTINV